MQNIAYIEQLDPHVQSRVRRRYSRECGTLATLGFEELGFYSEQLGAYSAVLYLPMTLLMLFKGEVLGGHGRFDAGGSYVLMRHRHPSTVALPLGLGVKLYTGFTDGTLLVSASFNSHLLPEGDSVVKHASKLPLDEAWAVHQQRVEEMKGRGKQVREALDYRRFVEMSQQEESASACSFSFSCAVRPEGS